MKKTFKSMQLFAMMLFAGASVCFTACSDDDDVKNPDEVTVETMFGDYKGTVSISDLAVTGEDNAEETEPGLEISATIKDNTINLVKFPIKDIVLSIIGDETMADMIVNAVGDVDYSIPYEPTLTPQKDYIHMTLKPEPLKLAVEIPSTQEDADTPSLIVEVQIKAGEDAVYDVEDANVKFNITATKVLLGEGDDQQELGDFVPKAFQFDMNQYKVVHNS